MRAFSPTPCPAVTALASLLVAGVCLAAPASKQQGLAALAAPDAEMIPAATLAPAVRQAVANGAATLLARITAPGNPHGLAFPPAQTMVNKVVEVEKIPAKRVTVQVPVMEHEYTEVEKVVPIIESGQPTGRFQKVKQRVPTKSKQVGTRSVEQLQPDPSGTEYIERPKMKQEPGGPAAWAPNLPGLNGMALLILAKAGLAKHPATVKHAAALAAHVADTRGLPDTTFDVAWMAAGFAALGPESAHAKLATRLVDKLLDGQVREKGKLDGLWGPVCVNYGYYGKMFTVHQKVREELDVNIPKLLATANQVQQRQIVATGEAMRAFATAHDRTQRDVFRAGPQMANIQAPFAVGEDATVPGLPLNVLQVVATDVESTEAAAAAIAEASRAGMLPEETARLDIKKKYIHLPSKTNAVLKAAAKQLAAAIDDEGGATALVHAAPNTGFKGTEFPAATLAGNAAPVPALLDVETACSCVAAQAAVEWLVAADPDLGKVAGPKRQLAHDRVVRIANRWYEESASLATAGWQGMHQSLTVSHADLKKSATLPAPGKPQGVEGLPWGPRGCLYRIVPGFRGLFADKTSAKERLADGLFRQIAFRLLVLQDKHGQWSSDGNQVLSTALESLMIGQTANDWREALGRTPPGKIPAPDPVPYEAMLTARLQAGMPGGAKRADAAAFATLASLLFLVDGLERPVSLEGIAILPVPPPDAGSDEEAKQPPAAVVPADAPRLVERPNTPLAGLVNAIEAAARVAPKGPAAPAETTPAAGKPPADEGRNKEESELGTFDDLLKPPAPRK